MRVKVEPLAAPPLTIAMAVTVFASATGAALTELMAIAPAIMTVVELTPRLLKIAEQLFQGAADAFARGVFADAQMAATSARLLFSKKRSSTACRSVSPSDASASSSSGEFDSRFHRSQRIEFHFAFETPFQ